MTDETENGARRDRLGRQGWTAEMELRAEAARLEPRARAEFLERQGLTAPMVWTDAMVDRDRAERRARLGMPDRPAPLARRVNAARRVTRVIGAILARLVKRANL